MNEYIYKLAPIPGREVSYFRVIWLVFRRWHPIPIFILSNQKVSFNYKAKAAKKKKNPKTNLFQNRTLLKGKLRIWSNKLFRGIGSTIFWG